MNLLISFHSIFQDKDSLGRKEEVKHVGREEDLEVGGGGAGGELRWWTGLRGGGQ
jgi:hypothetical protein